MEYDTDMLEGLKDGTFDLSAVVSRNDARYFKYFSKTFS